MSGIVFIRRDWADQVCLVRMIANDTLATVAGAGYITAQAANIAAFNDGAFEWQVGDMVLAYCSDGWGFFTISPPYASLVAFAFAPSVTTPVVVGDFAVFSSTGGNLEDLGYLPSDAAKTRVVMAGSAVVANHIALFQDTTGTIDDTAATAINNGSIQAGLSGLAGTFVSFPGTAANGTLILAAVNAGGAFNTTISNAASVGQSQVISIPDSGATTANFIVSKSAADQHITVSGLQADAGPLISGISTGGFVGLVKAFPTTASKGFIAMSAAVNATGNFGTTITNALAQGQASVVTIPDPGATTSNFVLSQSNAPVNNVAFTKVITAGQAALAAAGKVTVQAHTSATSQFCILDVKVLKSTGLSGNAGDRLLSLSDGTIVFNNAGITAALLGTPILTVWGGTGNPLAVGASEVSTAGADIFLQYISGSADYNEWIGADSGNNGASNGLINSKEIDND